MNADEQPASGSSTPAPPKSAAWKMVSRVAAALLAVVFLYGALYAGSRWLQPQAERLAALDEEALRIEGYGPASTSGGAAFSSDAATLSDSASADAAYLRALAHLREARVTTLGLFPRYDEAELANAAALFSRVVQEAEPESFLQLEAAFYLGKARLAQGDRQGATQAFKRVAGGQGRRTPAALEILQALYEDAAYGGPSR